MTDGPIDDDPIEAYLDELLVLLRGSPRSVRRILAEVEAHLRDAVDDGATPAEAVARFGDVREVAAKFSDQSAVPVATLIRQLLVAGALLCGVGLTAIGASGAIAGVMDAVYGPRFVAGDLPAIRYTPGRCAELHALAPEEATCAIAAARHHTDEIEVTRLAAGVAGLGVLGAWFVLRRRWRTTPASGGLPPALVPAVATAVFGVATVALATQAMQSIGWRSTAGIGQWLSGAVIAAVVTVGAALVLVRELRRPTALRSG